VDSETKRTGANSQNGHTLPVRVRLRRLALRAAAYGIFGWCVEVLFTGIKSGLRKDRSLTSRTYLWMFPIYALAAPLFEPTHDRLRNLPLAVRAPVYAAGIMSVEYAAGWLLHKTLGSCPWDYSQSTPFHIKGYVRLDYAPFWALAGLALEHVHDRLDAVVAALEDSRAKT
jgi:uncharacterized membrane protein